MPDSIFNQNVTGWAVDPNSASEVSALQSSIAYYYGGVGVNLVRPLYRVPTDQVTVSVGVKSGCNNFLSNTGTSAPIPSWAVVGNSGDSIIGVYSTNADYEYWDATQNSSSSWSACWGGATTNLSTFSGVFPSNYGETATGISNMATEITWADIVSGSINHAIGITLGSEYCNGSVYPANRTDCGSHPGDPSEGTWFRFAPGTTCSPSQCSTPFATMVFNAILQYGMVAIDSGGANQLEAEQVGDWALEGNAACNGSNCGPALTGLTGTNPWEASTGGPTGPASYQVVASLPWSSLQVVDPPQ